MSSTTKRWVLASLIVAVATVGMISSAAAEGGSSLDEELEEYWATERDVAVIEQRLFERANRFSAGLYGGVLTSEPFYHYYPVGARIGYFTSNAFGLEVGGAFMDADFLTHDDELMELLKERDEREDTGFEPAHHTTDRYLWRANAMALWSPFYGKLAALQQKLLHFDLNLGLGLGAVGVERPDPDRQGAEDTVTPEMVLGLGAHFYLGDMISLRFDGRGYLHRAAVLPTNEDSFFQQLNFPVEFQLGLSFLF